MNLYVGHKMANVQRQAPLLSDARAAGALSRCAEATYAKSYVVRSLRKRQ